VLLRRNKKGHAKTPWQRRRRRVVILVMAFVLLLSPWLVWRLRMKVELGQAIEQARVAGVPQSAEERAAMLAAYPVPERTELFREAAEAYVLRPLDVLENIPTFRIRNREEEARLYSRPYPEELLQTLRVLVGANEQVLALLLQADTLPEGCRSASSGVSEELVELLCAEACVRAADGDGAGAVRAILCGVRYHECALEPYSPSGPIASSGTLTRLMNALFSAASQTELPDDVLQSIHDRLDPSGWEEQVRLAERYSIGRWFEDINEEVAPRQFLVLEIVFGMLTRQRLLEIRGWQFRQQLIGKPLGEQRSLLAAIEDEPWRFWARLVRPPVHLEVARVALAIVRYGQAEGRYPASLDVLVPAYCEAIPLDFYTGEHFRYETSGTSFTLMSPGEDPGANPTPRDTIAFQASLPPA
jgi:hypothetical protein